MTAKLRIKPGAPEYRFDFAFPSLTTTPVTVCAVLRRMTRVLFSLTAKPSSRAMFRTFASSHPIFSAHSGPPEKVMSSA